MKSLELVQRRVARRLFLALLFLLTTANGQPVDDALAADNADTKVIYDQRQSGKYNIRINIKDVAIIEMDNSGFGDENISEEDYGYYDEEDLTVKPLNFTKPPKATTPHEVISTTASQQVTSPTTQATLLPTKLEESLSAHSTPIATTISQHNYNTHLLMDSMASQATPDVTTQESSGMSSRLLPSLHTTQKLLEPRTHYTIISSLSTAQPTAPKPSLASPISVQAELPKISGAQAKNSKTSFVLKSQNNQNFVNKFGMLQTPRSPLYPPAKGYGLRCRTHQYRDLSGGCRNKRSSSFLKKLLSIIATFPFKHAAKDEPSE
uniref:Coiled-coil domain-containing protein 71 n=1 Tax=Zeugodacus cucurbitae TaxID=28588 RepID=A0A0A1WNV4_ZEUCU